MDSRGTLLLSLDLREIERHLSEANMLSAIIAMLLLAAPGSGAAPRPTSPVAENPDQVICRAPQPVLGSRVARRRICRTRAEWRAFEADRAQMRRDLNAGNCAGATSCSCTGPDC